MKDEIALLLRELDDNQIQQNEVIDRLLNIMDEYKMNNDEKYWIKAAIGAARARLYVETEDIAFYLDEKVKEYLQRAYAASYRKELSQE